MSGRTAAIWRSPCAVDSLDYDEETKEECAEELAMLFDDWKLNQKNAEVV